VTCNGLGTLIEVYPWRRFDNLPIFCKNAFHVPGTVAPETMIEQTLFRSDYISARFSAVCHGYLRTPGHRLKTILDDLPPATALRERAIRAAIQWGVDHPALWDAAIAPLRLERRPEDLAAVRF